MAVSKRPLSFRQQVQGIRKRGLAGEMNAKGKDLGRLDEPTRLHASRYRRDGGIVSACSHVQREQVLEVYVNGTLAMRMACSSSSLCDLVVGRLLTEGVVRSSKDVVSLSLDVERMRAYVRIDGGSVVTAEGHVPVLPTSSSNVINLTGFRSSVALPNPVAPIPWRPEWVFRLADMFAEDKTAHRITRGSHSAYLAIEDEVLLIREDIGRHNAFDKAIGAATAAGLDLTKCTMYTSGRVPTDMALKAIRVGLPVLVSKSVATDKTIQLSRDYGLTLICSATSSSFDVLNDPSALSKGLYSVSA